jgi:hypothetical protein
VKKIKLNKQKLNEKWKEGGRVASRWCSYYLVEKEDNHYLIEEANWKAYLVTLVCSPLILVLFVLSLIQWTFNKIAERFDISSTPVSTVLSTLFTKEKVRTDWVKKEHLQNFKDC